MSTVVTIMDRAGFAANTDIIVLIEPEQRRLIWIPRDLWCEILQDRINIAFKRGGHSLVQAALLEHGIEATASLCFSRVATEALLAGVTVAVPVPVRMEFSYPLQPTARIEDGSKQIVFNPPGEILRGERIHQWVGARGASDLHRIERQKILLRRLLEKRFDFRPILSDPSQYRCSDPQAVDDLAQVRADWQFKTFNCVAPRTIAGKDVLVNTRNEVV